ncbi:MAG: hypothetical protein J3Q66DRAFT_394448 [Benniella sp.]|nr:MAG: hypothetical protein J3Q66DRAFT_394448 [Benniella sp.]
MDIVQGTTHRVGESAQSALSSMRQSSLVQRYVSVPSNWVVSKYQQSTAPVRFLLMGFGAMSAIPIGCFLGFMGVVTLGCLVVGGIAITIVEGGCALFGSAFLLPTLGVTFLIACGVGIVTLCLYCCYVVAVYIVSFFRGPTADRREIDNRTQAATERAREKAPETIVQRGGFDRA